MNFDSALVERRDPTACFTALRAVEDNMTSGRGWNMFSKKVIIDIYLLEIKIRELLTQSI